MPLPTHHTLSGRDGLINEVVFVQGPGRKAVADVKEGRQPAGHEALEALQGGGGSLCQEAKAAGYLCLH